MFARSCPHEVRCIQGHTSCDSSRVYVERVFAHFSMLRAHQVPPTRVRTSPGTPRALIVERSTRTIGCHSPAIHGTSAPSSPRKKTGPALPGGALTSTVATKECSTRGRYSPERTIRRMTTLFMKASPPGSAGAPLHINPHSALSPLCEASHKGEWHFFEQIDLAALQVKGTPGDVVTLVGNSR